MDDYQTVAELYCNPHFKISDRGWQALCVHCMVIIPSPAGDRVTHTLQQLWEVELQIPELIQHNINPPAIVSNQLNPDCGSSL